MLSRATDYLLRTRVSAIMAAFVLAFVPLIGSVSILIAALVTLRKGVVEGAFVTIAATLPMLLSYFFYPPVTTEISFTTLAILVVAGSNVLTWAFAALLRRYAHWSFVLELAATVGILTVVLMHLIHPDIQGWWQTTLTNYLNKTESAMAPALDAEIIARQAEAIAKMKFYATGFLAASILFNALLQLLVARWWQSVIFNPRGLRVELYQIRLSYVAGAIFVLGLALFYFGNPLVSDIMPVLFLIFCLSGLSVVHFLAAISRFGWLWLLLIYIGMIGLFPAGIVGVSMIGLLDSFFNIRNRYKR